MIQLTDNSTYTRATSLGKYAGTIDYDINEDIHLYNNKYYCTLNTYCTQADSKEEIRAFHEINKKRLYFRLSIREIRELFTTFNHLTNRKQKLEKILQT
jgi:hypothetical protein